MDVEFSDDDLDRLEIDPGFNAGLSRPIVRAFRKVMVIIRAAPSAQLFSIYPGLHFKQLKGKRAHQHSMRLNDQWRLILEIDKSRSPPTVTIIAIEDYH